MVEVKDILSTYISQFDQWEKRSGRSEPSWLLPIRKAAIAQFAELGFPTAKDETWRFTDVSAITDTELQPGHAVKASVSQETLSPSALPDCAATAVFINGRFNAELSQLKVATSASTSTAGVSIKSLVQAIHSEAALLEPHLARHADFREEPFVALNTALFNDGAFVHIRRGTVLEKPIHLLFISTQSDQSFAIHPRVLVVAEPNSQVTLVETYAGTGQVFSLVNAVTEIVAHDGAVIDHYRVGRESESAYDISTLQLVQHRNSNISSFVLNFGGALTRNNINTLLNGEGGHCALTGLTMARHQQHVDNHLLVDHAKPHCDSREFFKGIYDDESRGVFTGRIIVRESAQKTDGKQTNMSLLLSKNAQVESKPQLEIFADDVKCTHGATIGQVDEDAIFYLRSRGLDETLARNLLVHAFAGECVERIHVASLRERVEQWVLNRLPGGSQLEGA